MESTSVWKRVVFLLATILFCIKERLSQERQDQLNGNVSTYFMISRGIPCWSTKYLYALLENVLEISQNNTNNIKISAV